MTISETLEVEIKFEVGADASIPSAAALAPLRADEPVVHHLSATYYDTADLSLTRHKVTLRRRTGGDDAGWHLKLPSQAGRVELQAPLGNADEVPSDLIDAVAGLVRRRPLTPVARVDNERHVVVLREPDGTAVVEFCDDHVSTESFVSLVSPVPAASPESSADADADSDTVADPSASRGASARSGGGDWREWEAELVDPSRPGASDHLAVVAAACSAAGATPSSSPSKLARALGPLPDVVEQSASPVSDALARDLRQLLDHDPAARRVTVVGVHQMRVAVRGLRSTIDSYAGELEVRTAGTDIDPAELLEELKVLAAVLGKARDIQVVEERLGRLASDYPEDVVSPQTRRRLGVDLKLEEERAGARVTAALLSDRYLDLIDRLHELVRLAGTDDVAADDRTRAKGGTKRREAQDLVLRGVDRQFTKFTKARTCTQRDLDSLDLTLAQREELTHVVRKRAKALRRTVSALPASDDLMVAPLSAACQRLHTVLGDVQDSVTSRQWIRRIARRAESAGESTFGFGVLYERERAFSERVLSGFESDAAAVTAAYRELGESRRSGRRRARDRGRRKAPKGRR